MRRRIVNWRWEDPDAQRAFADWVGFHEEQAAAQIDRIEIILDISPPMRILDIGCGTGRHSIELARRGYAVVGIDVAESYLEVARARAARAGLSIEFRLGGGADLADEGVYGGALAYDHTLGFMDEGELRRHFARIRRALAPGARLLLKTAGPRLTPPASTEHVRNWSERDGQFILSEKWMADGLRHENCLVIDTVADEIVEYREVQRAFSLEQVTDLLEDAGFVVEHRWSDIDGTPATLSDFCVYICVT